jgi:hypothetical protein
MLNDRGKMKYSGDRIEPRIILPVIDAKERASYNFDVTSFVAPRLLRPRLRITNKNNDPGVGPGIAKRFEYVSSEKTGCAGDQVGGLFLTHDTMR